MEPEMKLTSIFHGLLTLVENQARAVAQQPVVVQSVEAEIRQLRAAVDKIDPLLGDVFALVTGDNGSNIAPSPAGSDVTLSTAADLRPSTGSALGQGSLSPSAGSGLTTSPEPVSGASNGDAKSGQFLKWNSGGGAFVVGGDGSPIRKANGGDLDLPEYVG
jgi:hypothetical protein